MSQLKFGTSGIRGLVVDFTLDECCAYSEAFLESVKQRGWKSILIAGDLRQSTPEIKEKVTRSFQSLGIEVIDGGDVPTPALAWGCAVLNLPGVMITGSHIPADRNGLKFYFPEGEILKADEESILRNYEAVKNRGIRTPSSAAPVEKVDLSKLFSQRYGSAFAENALSGFKIGFYSHSSVARDLYPAIFKSMGAEVFEFGRSDVFIPVDTEAVESVSYLYQNLKEHDLDLVVSTDGDADRPLVICDDGRVVPGEILGLIASKYLDVQTMVYPVSCSSALQDSGWIEECCVTRIGSPYVLGRMLEKLKESPNKKVVGFEANGGFLLGSEIHKLKPLMTRDSLLPILCFLMSIRSESKARSSEMLQPFASVANISGLIKNYPLERSAITLSAFQNILKNGGNFDGISILGNLILVNELDGIRARYDSGITVHLRPSGNAPEFRLYIEAKSIDEASAVLAFFDAWVKSR